MKQAFLILTILFAFGAKAQPDHSAFNDLLMEHVDVDGVVDYKAFKEDKEELLDYLALLEENAPSNAWKRQDQLAYWINTYNAWTIMLILDNYPLESIKDINSPWQQKIAEVGDQVYSLDYLENSIIRRKFLEPRIHFAVNCASKSCPPLRNEAYTGNKLYEQLDEQARRFINDPSYNQVGSEEAKLSRIFDWYKEDFLKEGSIQDYLSKYADQKPNSDSKISYLKYDWSLND